MIISVKDNLTLTLKERLDALDSFAASRLANLARKSGRILIESKGEKLEIEANLSVNICVVADDGATPAYTNDQDYIGGLLKAGDLIETAEIDPAKISIKGFSNTSDELSFIYITA